MRSAILGLTVLMLAATLPTAAQTKSSALLVMLRHNKAAGVMAIVNPATGKITARVRTGEDPHGVAVSADGKMAFVVNTSGKDGESLSVIDVVGQKEIRRLNFPKSRPHDVQVSRGKVFFTAGGQNAIGRYDPVSNQTEWLSTGTYGTRMMSIHEASDTLYASSQSSKNVLILEGISKPASQVKLTVVPLGHAGEGISVSPDGREVWTANNDKSGVSIVDIASKKVVTIPVSTDHANRIQFSPDGKRVLLLDREVGTLIIFDAVQKKELKRINPPGARPGDLVGIGDITMAADGSHAYITVQDMDDSGPRDKARQVAGGGHYVAAIDLRTLEISSKIATDVAGDEMAWAEMK